MTLATRAVVTTYDEQLDVVTHTWTGLDSDDDGTAVGLDPKREYFAQLTGTLGTGGSVNVQVSFDGGTTYGVARDLGGNACTLNAIGLVKHLYTWGPKCKPLATAGDGSTLLNVVLIGVRKED